MTNVITPSEVRKRNITARLDIEQIAQEELSPISFDKLITKGKTSRGTPFYVFREVDEKGKDKGEDVAILLLGVIGQVFTINLKKITDNIEGLFP